MWGGGLLLADLPNTLARTAHMEVAPSAVGDYGGSWGEAMAMEVVEQKGGETIACGPIAPRILELRDVPVRAVVHRDDDRAE